MSIKVKFTQKMIERARLIMRDADSHANKKSANDYTMRKFGLSYTYLKTIGRSAEKPSARVLHNLGYELWIKDLVTLKMERLEMDLPWEWNVKLGVKSDPSKQKAKSIKELKRALKEQSTGSELNPQMNLDSQTPTSL